MKHQIKLSQLKSFVRESVKRQLVENIASDLLPGSEGKLADYTMKVTKFLDSTLEEAGSLADEGEELMRADYTQKNPSVGERNRLLLVLIGYLRKLKFNLAASNLDLRKMMG